MIMALFLLILGTPLVALLSFPILVAYWKIRGEIR